MTDDIAKIAHGLTKAQRNTLCYRPEYGDSFGTIYGHTPTMRVLNRRQLFSEQKGGWAHLSPLGLAIRAYLMGQHNEPA